MEPTDEAGRGERMEIRVARTGDAAQACMVLRRSIEELCHADHNGDAARLACQSAPKADPSLGKRNVLF
jgi:hypothetical protein